MFQFQGEPLKNLFDDEQKYTLIMYSLPIDSQSLALVQAYGQKHKAPLISIHSAGFYSYFRVHLPGAFPIVDTHPDSTATTDLRLLTPWAELSDFAAKLTKDLEGQSAHDHGHIPYVVLLLHYLAEWKKSHGQLPSTYNEKVSFRETVAAGARTDNGEGGEENFEEAAAAVLRTISSPIIADSVKEVFDYKPNEVRITPIAHRNRLIQYSQEELQSSFWVIAAAIKKFYAKHNALPLPGSVPDMKAQSSVYVQLQNLYKARARQDVAEVLETVRADPRGERIDVAEVETFCKNAAFIKLIHSTDSAPRSIQAIASMYLSPAWNDAC